ncbi:MAG: AAA family ATPase [Prevotella sp.]|jgi:cytidylate kinase
MNRNEKFVITINRQFGTGGHEIGAALAKKLGVKLIDRQILQSVAKQFNLTEDEALRLESRKPSWWEDFSKFYQNFISVDKSAKDERSITSRQLYYAQAKAMRGIAECESCVIIGRCGFHIFRDHPNALRIFLHSPLEKRLARIEERYGVDEERARMMIEDNDYVREVYTKSFTGTDWYDARNYDLTLDVGNYGVNGAVDFLLHFVGDNW